MNQAKESKTQNFISVYNNHIDEIYQYVLLRTGFDVPLAEDITQDIFLDVFKGLRSFKGYVQKEHGFLRLPRTNCLTIIENNIGKKLKFLLLTIRWPMN